MVLLKKTPNGTKLAVRVILHSYISETLDITTQQGVCAQQSHKQQSVRVQQMSYKPQSVKVNRCSQKVIRFLK